MQSLIAMLTAKQTGALANALVMLGAPPAPGGTLTDSYLRSCDPDALRRAGVLCGPRTATLCAMFADAIVAGAPAGPAPIPTPAATAVAVAVGADAPGAPTSPSVPLAPSPSAGTESTAGAVFGISGVHAAIPVTVFPGAKAIDKSYVFRPDLIAPLLYAWKAGENAWLFGPPGTGKTTMIREMAARLGRPFFRVNFADGVDRSDLIGQDTLKGGDVAFRAGSVLRAIRTPNSILLLDEPGAGRPEDMIALHPILDGSGASIIPQTGEELTVAPGVNVAVANNNRGDVDRTGTLPGLRPQSEPFRDRFGVFIEVPHLTVTQEGRLLRKRVPALDKATAIALATVLQASRELSRKEDFPQAAISHRQALSWARLMGQGMTPQAAFTAAVGARHDAEIAEALQALFLKNFAPGEVSAEAVAAADKEDGE